MQEGLEKGETKSSILTLRVDYIETDTPLDIKLIEEKDIEVYKGILVKPPLPAMGVRNDYRYSRIKIRWAVSYHD